MNSSYGVIHKHIKSSKAQVSFINHEAFVFDAIYGITIDAKAIKTEAAKGGLKSTVEKQLTALPFAAIAIPKIITIEPQIVINAAASTYADAHGEFRAGARFSITEGEVVLDATAPEKNKASGFKPSLEPIFEPRKGRMVATAELSLPVGVEVALDVLGGTWKKSVRPGQCRILRHDAIDFEQGQYCEGLTLAFYLVLLLNIL